MSENLCDGNGHCFKQIDNFKWIKEFDCIHKCELKKCPCFVPEYCSKNEPQWVLDCHEDFCMSCGSANFSAIKETKDNETFSIYPLCKNKHQIRLSTPTFTLYRNTESKKDALMTMEHWKNIQNFSVGMRACKHLYTEKLM